MSDKEVKALKNTIKDLENRLSELEEFVYPELGFSYSVTDGAGTEIAYVDETDWRSTIPGTTILVDNDGYLIEDY